MFGRQNLAEHDFSEFIKRLVTFDRVAKYACRLEIPQTNATSLAFRFHMINDDLQIVSIKTAVLAGEFIASQDPLSISLERHIR